MSVLYIRDYYLSYDPGDTSIWVATNSTQKNLEYLPPFPTEEEANEAFSIAGVPLAINTAFNNCTNLKATPKLPKRAYMGSTLSSQAPCRNCISLRVPPKLPVFANEQNKRLTAFFYGCSSLAQGPIIPNGAGSLRFMFQECPGLLAPVSLPASVSNVGYMYENDSSLSGEMIIRGTPTSYANMLTGTTKPITLYGDKAICDALAATAENGNAAWAAWYDPVPAVTNRGPGSFTTATDMTRMVRNGALAVSTYAPGRMVYQQGDIVREDEWNALVEAAQTIDPTVTYSTHYANLNKIEAAFDSAL